MSCDNCPPLTWNGFDISLFSPKKTDSFIVCIYFRFRMVTHVTHTESVTQCTWYEANVCLPVTLMYLSDCLSVYMYVCLCICMHIFLYITILMCAYIVHVYLYMSIIQCADDAYRSMFRYCAIFIIVHVYLYMSIIQCADDAYRSIFRYCAIFIKMNTDFI